MPLLPKNCAPLTACLTLGTLLCASPTPADPPTTPVVSRTQWQKLTLQHVIPSQILKSLKWDQSANLPAGVTRVYALESDNALFVQATPNGFSSVLNIVKSLDIMPRQVQVKMTLAWAADADLKASGVKLDTFSPPAAPTTLMGDAIGKDVAAFAEMLQKQGSVLRSPTITTSNNVSASISISNRPLRTLPAVDSVTFAVTPRVNSDDTVTLVLDPKATWRVAGKTNPDGTPATTTQDFQTLYTVRSGDTLVITNVFPGAAGAGNGQLLLFVTPTVLPDDGSDGPVTVTGK